ncbi:MAG: nucleotide exchange factor GrpE [Acidimicrobiales bacterium]|nr:nucleotide exchange factor GrpE [Acidimicrobiales bacterium]
MNGGENLPAAESPLPDDEELLEAAAIAEEDIAEVEAGETAEELAAEHAAASGSGGAARDGGSGEPATGAVARESGGSGEPADVPDPGEEVFVDGTVGRSDLAAERDEFRDALLRVKADFDNYKKRVAKEHAERVERAAEGLVTNLLPVLDACDAAIGHGSTDVEPILKSLLDVLEKEGLERIEAVGEPFDPARHEAVLHEPSESGDAEVVECLRTGYAWKGRVIRPAMVKVKG